MNRAVRFLAKTTGSFLVIAGALGLTARDGIAQPISFQGSILAGTNLTNPTSLQFGPDDRLYVAQQDGRIFAYTIIRNSATSYSVTSSETIDLIRNMPNHQDDGTASGATGRQVTGILVTGSASQPIIYVTSSDPRIGFGPVPSGLDTNSGVLSRLTWNGVSWNKLDLVRGLPRSQENHASNGMFLDEATNTLYLAQGGHTNQGAPSNNFGFLPEVALSAAILAIDLDAIGNTTYNLPTLDDEDRPGNPDMNDPFGGNEGKNQAILVAGGPVRVHAPGFRNAYDVVITEAGRMYTVDNGPNSGWGDVPIGDGTASCTNDANEPGVFLGDGLHLVTGPGYYGGHANPTRGNAANTFNASNPQSPVPGSNAEECTFLSPTTNPAVLAVFQFSTNGITEYTASDFGGALQGDLLMASFNATIYRVKLNAAGNNVTLIESMLSSQGALDVIAQGDFPAPFAGTIWTANHGNHNIGVFEPTDLPGCTGADNASIDEDGDCYDNADEVDNGTNPCSAGSKPSDYDLDCDSDLNDADDDNDGLLDTVDRYAQDPDNGATTDIPFFHTYDNDGTNPGGLLNLGFTGLMSNGATNYMTAFDPANMTARGAAGVVTVDLVPEGDALQTINTQEYGFQVGTNVGPTSPPFTIHTRIIGPFLGQSPEDFQSMGLFFGDGTQDGYAKVVVAASGLQFVKEEGGVVTSAPPTAPLALPGPSFVDLYLHVNPVASTIQAAYAVSMGSNAGPITPLTGAVPIPSAWLTHPTYGPAIGVLSTSRGSGPPFPATWDFLAATLAECSTNGECNDANSCTTDSCVAGLCNNMPLADETPCNDGLVCTVSEECSAGTCLGADTCAGGQYCDAGAGFCLAGPASAFLTISPTGGINASTFDFGSFAVSNTSTGGVGITAVRLDIADAVFPDIVFDPVGTAGDAAAKCLTSDGPTITVGYLVPADPCTDPFSGPHDGGYDAVELLFNDFDPGEMFSFSVDIDPTSIKGAGGAGAAGSVSGLELTGSLIEVDFDNGTTLSARLFRTAGSQSGAENIIALGAPAAPGIVAFGIGAGPATVTNPSQTIRVTGPAGATVRLLQVEGALELIGAPGFDIDPFEANTAVLIGESQTTVGMSGFVDVPVTLTRSSAIAGLNHFVATIADEDGSDRTGTTSAVLVLELDAACQNDGDCDPGEVCDVGTGQCVVPEPDEDNDGIADDQDPCPSEARNACYGPAAVDQTTGQAIRINTGVSGTVECAGTKIDCNGQTWFADNGYNQEGQFSACDFNGGGENCVVGGIPAIFGCDSESTEDIFQCEHWDAAGGEELIYSFNVPNGNYLVNLLFAETFTGASAAGQRVFDILIEGATVYMNFDQFSAAGGAPIAVVRSRVVNVSDGNGLQLSLGHVTENPSIKGIEVLTLAGCTTPTDCDDGNPCTADSCTGGECVNSAAAANGAPCNDGSFCNGTDTCSNGACTAHAGNPCIDGQCTAICNESTDTCTVCDDANPCTEDSCVAGACVNAGLPRNGFPCDDGLFCNGPDTCDSGQCADHAGDPCPGGPECANVCNEAADNCHVVAGTSCTDDGNVCTDNECNGSGLCVPVANNAPCTDGLFCNGTDTCSGGNCSLHSGDLCTGGPDCLDVCNEDANECLAPQGTPCSDDGNPCTDNLCDGLGTCLAFHNSVPCNDGIFCNGADTCSQGTCALHAGNPCAASQLNCSESSNTCGCVALTLPESIQCPIGQDCTIPVFLDRDGAEVASVAATFASTPLVNCADECVAGSAATNGTCSIEQSTCRFLVADLSPPIRAFDDGEVAQITIQCTQSGFGEACLEEQSAGLRNGKMTEVCGDQCSSFACGECLPGDCNANGSLDAGDPICVVNCLIDQAAAEFDCTCAANCNCLQGTEASDATCTVLRLIDDFPNDPCAGGQGAFTLPTEHDDAGAVVRLGNLKGNDAGRRKRAFVRIEGTMAGEVAAVRVALAADGAVGKIRLPRRLRRAGFALAVGRSELGHAVIVVTGPLDDGGVRALGRGRVARVRLPDDSEGLAITGAQLGSTLGHPVHATW